MNDLEAQPDVQLPGYELIERIGSGGYGEVWSAVAPGGLRKAVKFVFGGQFDRRATSELHALEKVKSVRHPFLLSLERIEVVQGRLVVVSELADGSLRDRFLECVQQGMPGIPRDELLGYLSDAADALDHISSRHDLAHLDIKPENLLLVAGHVKVADFGLVKSLSNQTQGSLVGGMTPLYAAPEVFRGSPSRHSDQYSLAILYQEMLAGAVPFPGVNAAELTLQHMGVDPDLHGLAESDRFVIARALAKEPTHRFDSATALVAALRGASRSAAGGVPEFAARPASGFGAFLAPSAARATEVFEDAFAAAPARQDSIRVFPDPLDRPDAAESEPPAVAPAAEGPFCATPAVFIGIGATGARVLRSLRTQIAEHLGATGPLPAAPMVLFDTDPQTLGAATRCAERGAGLEASETVLLPLRRPQQYRDKADLLLRWLGRRWLYNIPRTLRTEGIRPLGRLALVDHARQAFQRVRGALMQAVDEASRAETTEAVGLPFDAPGLRVYVVGSAAGAAGSGMSIDIAYAVRSIAERLGVERMNLVGIITHSTFRDPTRNELARVNSYAWLSEFEGFRAISDGYPGDPSVGLPPHGEGVPAFDSTYFVPLGEKIDTPAFESAADAVAEYLFADAFTPNQRVLDACRAAVPESPGTLRSFAVRHRDGQTDATLQGAAREAAARLLDRWSGDAEPLSQGDGQVATDQLVHGAVAFLGRTQLDSSTLASNCRALLEASLGGDASAFVDGRFGGDPVRTAGEGAAAIDRCFGVVTADAACAAVDGKDLATIVDPITQKLTEETAAWALGRVNDAQERLPGARRAVVWLEDFLAATDADLQKVAANVATERTRVAEGPAPAAAAVREWRIKLFRLRLDQAAIAAARRIVARLRARVAELPRDLDGLQARVTGLRHELAGERSTEAPPAEVEALALAIERRLQSDYLTSHGGLLGALTAGADLDGLQRTIAHAATVVARDHCAGERASADAALGAGFAAPPLESVGGAFYRLTLLQPSAAGDEAAGEEVLLVTEMAGASLPHVAAQLIDGRRDYAAFAERVRTRRDIAWRDAVACDSISPVTAATFPAETSLQFPTHTAVLA